MYSASIFKLKISPLNRPFEMPFDVNQSKNTSKTKITQKNEEWLIKQVLPLWVADEESKKLIDDAL